MNPDVFDYDLPEHLIAQKPAEKRTDSRLLVLEKDSGRITHSKFSDLSSYLGANDLIVLNNSRVIQARLLGKKKTGGAIEILLLRRLDSENSNRWEAIFHCNSKRKTDFEFDITPCFGGRVLDRLDPSNGTYEIEFNLSGNDLSCAIEKNGNTPLPPYIRRKTPEAKDRERYQTVYAKVDGSVAAPTAGLHFSDEMLSELSKKTAGTCELTLHVGLGTFRPVKADRIEDHVMHREFCEIDSLSAEKINSTKKNAGSILAVGTTSVRTLESMFDPETGITPGSMETEIFIHPPYEFRCVDKLLTNFHLPKSTLLMLVSAMAGTKNVLAAYREAVDREYRFFSYGDAMLIL